MLINRGIIAVAFASVAQAVSRADPPYFPADCKAPSVTPEIRDMRLGVLYLCARVGETCKSSKDCTRPKASECYKERTDRRGIFAVPATCIDGLCRIVSNKKESPCDCLSGCDLKDFDRDLSCIDGRCKAAECAPCGELPNNRSCCAPGVEGPDGKCFCGTGAGEGCATQPQNCYSGKYNDICCGRGTDNEGKCCSSGTCNGECYHQLK